jgi:WD40 repeat protein
MVTFNKHTLEGVNKLLYLDEKYLAVAYESPNTAGQIERTIRIFNWKTGYQFGCLIGHEADVYGLVNVMDAKEQVASSSCYLTIRIWHWPSTRLLKNLTGHKSCLIDLVSLSNYRLAVCALKS